MTITTRQQVRVRVNEMIRAKQVRVVDD